jgi:hypothetical protein
LHVSIFLFMSIVLLVLVVWCVQRQHPHVPPPAADAFAVCCSARFRVSSVAHPRCLADVRVSPHRFISELAKAEALEKVEAKAEAEKKKD